MTDGKFELSIERRINASVEKVYRTITERCEEWFVFTLYRLNGE